MNNELKSLSFWEILSTSIKLYFNNIIYLIVVSFLCFVPYYIFKYFASPLGLQINVIVDRFVNLLVQSLVSGMTILVISKRYLGEYVGFRDYVKLTLKKIFPVIVLSLLINIATAIGLALLVIPGILLRIYLYFSLHALILEDEGIFPSMRRSWGFTSGYRWTIFGLSFIVNIIHAIIMVPFGMILGRFLPGRLFGLALVIESLAAIALTSIHFALSIVIYYNIRVEKEGFEVEHLSRQFSIVSNDSKSELPLNN